MSLASTDYAASSAPLRPHWRSRLVEAQALVRLAVPIMLIALVNRA